MKNNSSKSHRIGLIIGLIGLLASIALLFTESWLIGIFGSIACAGLVYNAWFVN